MQSLFTYLQILESTFTSRSWSHAGKYDYAESVLKDILDGKELLMTDGSKISASDFDKDAIAKLLGDLKNTTDEEGIKAFQAAYTGSYKKSVWSNIEKTTYSGKFRKIGGGLGFEDALCNNLQMLVQDEKAEIAEYKEATMKFWDAIKNSNAIKTIKEKVTKGEDPSLFIQVTGKGSTARNNIGQIINKETFEVNMSKQINLDSKTEDVVTNVLTQSGKIIADVTISAEPNPGDKKWDIDHVDKDDIFISCKDGDAQLTGISMQQPFYGDDSKTAKTTTLTKAYDKGETYDEFVKHNDICTKAFASMCKMFDCDPEEVYNYFATPKNQRKSNTPLKVGKVDIGNDIISTLMQLQIGGNYWYVNSKGDVVYLDDDLENNRFKFIAKGSGKMEPSLIRINGQIKTKDGSVNCDLVFRTSGTFDYPYRLFFDIKDKHIIQKLYV